MRAFLYALARFLGDVRAIQRGRILPRVANKVIGRKIVSKVWFR